jgi:hypothetical protein
LLASDVHHEIMKVAARLSLAAAAIALAAPLAYAEINIVTTPATNAALQFAAREIERAVRASGVPAGPREVLLEVVPGGPPQGYCIAPRPGGQVRVSGSDAAGVMYGGLDIAEALRLGTFTALGASQHQPHIARRGIKFNIPLDLRTPSYSDCSDSFQANIPEVWSRAFWREFLDEMARNRLNVLTLWSLHPFPSLVKVPEYPDVALDDVWRTTLPLDDSFSHSGSDMVRPVMLERHEVVKRLTIDEKIRFWRDVMEQAHDRGIEVYLFTWNIFTFGATGKYGITPSPTNRATIDYFRASVRETVLTYPRLAGMGITAGEQMPNRPDYSKEQWLWQTYGEGIRDGLKAQPARPFRLIHRYHMTGQGEILREWKDYPGPLDFSFKYAIAHMYSATNPPFILAALPNLPPDQHTWLTVRNDDIYSFRWGDPQFARDFIRCMPGRDQVAGFYMGPDGYCWGREFIDRAPETPRQLVMQKQWFSFMLWGRLSYDPTLPDALFERTLAQRFPEVPAGPLLEAWGAASRIIPQVTRFFWGDIDVRWFPEACLSHPRVRGFYTVRHFIEGETMPGSGILNIRQYRSRRLGKMPMQGITPLQVAEQLDAYSERACELSTGLIRKGDSARRAAGKESMDKDLRRTLLDLEAFAHLGLYYSQKIQGATELALFDATGDAKYRDQAILHLEAARNRWKDYAATATAAYRPQLLNRVGYVDLTALTAKVEQDIAIARTWRPGAIPSDGSKPAGADRPFSP